MNNEILITAVNNKNIVVVENESELFVPIHPICDAIGIAFNAQWERVNRDNILSSTIRIVRTVGGDGKQREMICLPLKFIYGWLFTIDTGLVKQEAQSTVTQYKLACYNALYDYFTKRIKRDREMNAIELGVIADLERAQEAVAEGRATVRELKDKLAQIRQSRLDDQPTLF